MRTAIIAVILLTSCAAPAPKTQNVAPVAQANNSQPINSEWRWKSEAAKDIHERVRVADLPDLNKVSLPEGDLEVRVWHGFSIFYLEGFVLKRSAGQWSALRLEGYDKRRPRSQYQIKLLPPKSGWEECWKRLEGAGLLTLPDASELGEEPVYPDAVAYVVECNAGGNYRTYHYTSPETNDHKEAKQMVKVGEIISEEFGLPTMKPEL